MQFLNFFLSEEPISVDSMPICFISNSIMLASALHYLAQQNVAGDLCSKFTALFYVCVSLVLSCFMIIPFVQESIRNSSDEMLLSAPDSLLASLPDYDTIARKVQHNFLTSF